MIFEVIRDFQFQDDKNKIQILEKGSKLKQFDQDTVFFKIKTREYQLPLSLIQSNPEFFKRAIWQDMLRDEMKSDRKKTVPSQHKQIVQFFQDNVFSGQQLVPETMLKEMLELVRQRYDASGDKKWLDIFNHLGWDYDEEGNIFKKF